MNGDLLPLAKKPKVLGIILDPLFTFSPHISHIAKKASKKLKIVKALAGTTWGQDTETLLITYKALVKSTLDYAAPIWSTNAKPSPLSKLQNPQNAGLRAVTGCHKIASQTHLHAETQMLPVADHVRMLSAQFLASCLRPSHPSHATVTLPSGPRQMKETLQSAHYDDVCDFLIDDVLPAERYNNVKSIIHATFVEDYI